MESKAVGRPLESKKQCERAIRSVSGGDRSCEMMLRLKGKVVLES